MRKGETEPSEDLKRHLDSWARVLEVPSAPGGARSPVHTEAARCCVRPTDCARLPRQLQLPLKIQRFCRPCSLITSNKKDLETRSEQKKKQSQ